MIRAMVSLTLAVMLSACGEEPGALEFPGYVEGNYLSISAPEAGWLEAVPVDEGMLVAAGNVLFRLDTAKEDSLVAEARARLAQAGSELADLRKGARSEDTAALEAQIAEAEAQVRLARQNLNRQQRLTSSNVATQAKLDEARAEAAQAGARLDRVTAELAAARLPGRSDRIAAAAAAVEAAWAAVAQAEWRLSQRTVTAPLPALVEDVVRDRGEWTPANGVVVRLLPPDALKVVLFVPEPVRATIQPGEELNVSCSGCPGGLEARVVKIATEPEYTPPVIYSRETRSKLVYRAEALLRNGSGLSPGQPVTVVPNDDL